MATLPRQKPDPKITGAMVLVNWLKHRWGMTYNQVCSTLGLKQYSHIGVLRRFEVNQSNSTKWQRIFENVPPECFLWNWQTEAHEYLLNRQSQPEADKEQIDLIIRAISAPSGRITSDEASKWADEINVNRRN